jgi:hypothetical protein
MIPALACPVNETPRVVVGYFAVAQPFLSGVVDASPLYMPTGKSACATKADLREQTDPTTPSANKLPSSANAAGVTDFAPVIGRENFHRPAHFIQTRPHPLSETLAERFLS